MPTKQGMRNNATGSSSFELSGAFAGQPVSVEGGDVTAYVIEEELGADSVVHKHVAGVRYTDIQLECGAAMERSFFDWIQDTLSHKFTRKSGAISFLDFRYQEHSRLEFANALITGISFPALDAASKDAATMTVKLSPENTWRKMGSGQERSAPVGPKGHGAWTPANFNLQIDGLDCTAVNKVEPLIVTTAVAENIDGELRDYQKEPAHLKVPDLVVTLSESHAATFYAWHEEFVIKGLNGPEYEKNGTLEFLSSNRSDVLLTLQLKNLGIFKLASVKAPLASEGIARVRASMYCEEITFGAKSVAPPPPPPPPPPPVGAPAGATGGPEPVAAPAGATGGAPTERIVAGEFPRELPGRGLRATVDLQTDPRNCGTVGNDITNLFPNATALCVDGRPQMGECNPGYVDADGLAANGCELFTQDGVATSPALPTYVGTLQSGEIVHRMGVRGPSKPAWYQVAMPCNDSRVAHIQMRDGPTFTVFGQSLQAQPLVTNVTAYDVPLSPALTQLYVNVPAGPWASYTLIFSRQ